MSKVRGDPELAAGSVLPASPDTPNREASALALRPIEQAEIEVVLAEEGRFEPPGPIRREELDEHREERTEPTEGTLWFWPVVRRLREEALGEQAASGEAPSAPQIELPAPTRAEVGRSLIRRYHLPALVAAVAGATAVLASRILLGW